MLNSIWVVAFQNIKDELIIFHMLSAILELVTFNQAIELFFLFKIYFESVQNFGA